MNEPKLNLVGTVTTPPRLNRTKTSGRAVANFDITCTSRTFNRDRGRWHESSSLTMRVVCWGRLAENVSASVRLGDPVVISGTLKARTVQAPEGGRKVVFEATATAVGPDLTRGTATFTRNLPGTDPDEVERAVPATALGAAVQQAAGPEQADVELTPIDELPEAA